MGLSFLQMLCISGKLNDAKSYLALHPEFKIDIVEQKNIFMWTCLSKNIYIAKWLEHFNPKYVAIIGLPNIRGDTNISYFCHNVLFDLV